MPQMLSVDDELSIHQVLVQDFSASEDPITPAGVRTMDLLASAVSRQTSGYYSRLKYETPVMNAATLCFGICCDHPFHNGNKRTALVSTLCHLDRNDLILENDVSHDELYALMLRVASHGFAKGAGKRDTSDTEVDAIGRWFRKRTRRIERRDRVITCRELRNILGGFGFEFENPDNNHIDVVRYRYEKSWFSLKSKRVRDRVMRIPYPKDGAVVGRSLLKELRERCSLTEEDGVDSVMFYSKTRPADYFVTRYRGTLRRLAKV